MKKSLYVVIGSLVSVFCSTLAVASTVTSDAYQVSITVNPLGPQSYEFVYSITNLNQGSAYPQGFDGIFIQIPDDASITNMTLPATYSKGGFWFSGTSNAYPPQSGYEWLIIWGGNWQAVYPKGSTAQFSFDASNVNVGTNTDTLFTFWGYNPPSGVQTFHLDTSGTYYSSNNMSLTGPIAVTAAATPTPISSTVLLLGSGLLGLVGTRRVSSLKKEDR